MSEAHPFWRRFVAYAAGLELLLMLATAATLRDTDELVLAIGLAAGLLMLRLRRGALGVALLTILSGNIAFWTILGAASNVKHREDLIATLIPSAHAVIALFAFGAPFLLVLRHLSQRSGFIVLSFGAVAGLSIAIVTGLSLRGASVQERGKADLSVVEENTAFIPPDITAKEGDVDLKVENRDLFWHTFTIDELGVDLKSPVRSSRIVKIQAKVGTYRFYCRVPGHTLAGMKGTLIVTRSTLNSG